MTWARGMYTRVAEGNQIVLQEPTVAAIVVDEQKMVAWGQEAQDMLGKVPDSLEVTRPLINGVIADYEVTEAMLAFLLRKLAGPMLDFSPAHHGHGPLRCDQCGESRRPRGRLASR